MSSPEIQKLVEPVDARLGRHVGAVHAEPTDSPSMRDRLIEAAREPIRKVLVAGYASDVLTREAVVDAILAELRTPDEAMIEAGGATPGMKEIDNMVTLAANRGRFLGWSERGEPPPLSQAFTAAIDHIRGSS